MQLKLGIVGATGAVGKELLELIAKSHFPAKEIRCFASAKSFGGTLLFKGESLPVKTLSKDSFSGLDLVFFSAGGKISQEYVPLAKKAGAVVIDNSSAFRLDPNVPLIIPEVNPEAIHSHQGIISNPNCAAILMLLALAPLHAKARLKRIVVSTYQAASGAGLRAMKELQDETQALLEKRPYERSVMPYPYAFNLFLHNSPLRENGYLEEELKLIHETRKILGDDSIQVASTCVRVPVLRSHAEAINAEFHAPLSHLEALHLLKEAPGIELMENPTPLFATGKHSVFCGRVREDLSQKNTLDLWVVGDQLLKGAALNALQIAEKIFL